jgi:hypothetical protein
MLAVALLLAEATTSRALKNFDKPFSTQSEIKQLDLKIEISGNRKQIGAKQ